MSTRFTIKRLGSQGDGVAETETGELFIPFTLPGEVVNAAREKDRATLMAEPFPYVMVPGFVKHEAVADIERDFPAIEHSGSFPLPTLEYGPAFGAFIEGAAGFGAPVAVAGAMLAGLGFSPFYAAGICLLANTAPVAFGSIGIPVTTLANVTGLPVGPLSAMVGRLCAMISVFIPGYLIVVMVGRKKALEVLPAIIACGVSFAGVQFTVSNFVGPELTDIASSLTCIVVMVFVLKLWKPKNILRLEGDQPVSLTRKKHSGAEMFMARPARLRW